MTWSTTRQTSCEDCVRSSLVKRSACCAGAERLASTPSKMRLFIGLAPIACFPNHCDISYSFEPVMQPISNKGLIINQEQRDHVLLTFVMQLKCPLWCFAACLCYTRSEQPDSRYRSYWRSVVY